MWDPRPSPCRSCAAVRQPTAGGGSLAQLVDSTSESAGGLISLRGLVRAFLLGCLGAGVLVGLVVVIEHALPPLLVQPILTSLIGLASLTVAVFWFLDARRQPTADPPQSTRGRSITSGLGYAFFGLGLLALELSNVVVVVRGTAECRLLLGTATDSHSRLALRRAAPPHVSTTLVATLTAVPTCAQLLDNNVR